MPIQTTKTDQQDDSPTYSPLLYPKKDGYQDVLDLLDSRSDNDLEHVKQALRLLVQLLMKDGVK